MAMDVARVCECLYHHGGDQTGIIERQVGQRLELARFWGIQPGWKILEVGCGEGITTVGLAAAVGFEGRVTAVDLDGSEEWEDPTLGELTQFVTNSWLGERIEFLLGLDLLTSAVRRTLRCGRVQSVLLVHAERAGSPRPVRQGPTVG